MGSKAHHDVRVIIDLETPSLRRPVGDDDDAMIAAREAAAVGFGCSYCHRKFFSRQALGGHQNAHKLERNRDFHSSSSTTSTTTTSSSSISLPVIWLSGGRELWAAAAVPVMCWTWAPDHGQQGEAAAAMPEMDLKLKL